MGAILAALLYRERGGKGQYVETTLLDCYFSYHELNVQAASASHGEVHPHRAGAHHYAASPTGVFNGKSGPILIMAGVDHQFPLMCRAMGRSDLATDPRFKDFPGRAANAEELKRLVQEWIDSASSDDEVLGRSK
jgi:CoA:oxalate CoA-transferase